ncbi:MAG: GntP family permease [Selenomonas artemidis]|uniref:GntP family permease n=1 Tax=Selenomonas artemidis TaxID=671224 RepID=UPI0004154356|nr:GntP family permease [Selenomonas artemidis]
MTGLPLIIAFVVAIVIMIVMISKLRIHPFISIMLVSLGLGLAAGIPLVDHKLEGGAVQHGLATVIGQGFSGTFTSIGIVIILGAMIGTVLEKTGAALKLADMVIRLVGKDNPVIAVQLMGWVVSIPVFCDSGFVILDPIRKALIRRTAVSAVSMTFALSAGLFISHVFIPPTPGPIAAASTLGIGDYLLQVIGLGMLCSIFPLIAGYFFARWIGTKVQSKDEVDPEDVAKVYNDLMDSYGKLPSAFNTLAPIVVPILLMAFSSIVAMAGGKGLGADIVRFLGTPIIALAVGMGFATIQLAAAERMHEFYKICNDSLMTVGPILFITAAGGVLGKVIATSDMVHYISQHADVFSSMGIFFPFLLAAVLKTAQGSSTVSLITTAGIVGPLLPVLGYHTPIEITLVCMAIGAGAMTVSHANDSYFWVVSEFSGMTPDQGYRVQTMGTLVLGIAAIIEIALLSLVLH